jgi:hypothetical protein
MRKYRRKGFGRIVAKKYLICTGTAGKYTRWKPINRRVFLESGYCEYTNGSFIERTEDKRTIQQFENQSFIESSK